MSNFYEILCLIFVLAPFFMLFYISVRAIEIFIFGRIKRLELLNELLQEEYTLRHYSDLEEAMRALNLTCEYANDVLYKESEIRKFKRELLQFFIIALLSFPALNITKNLAQANTPVKNISVEKSK